MTALPMPIKAGRRGSPVSEDIPVEKLHLDSRNLRTTQVGGDLDERQILNILWREYSVDEVAWSIARSGFFRHEPLFAAEEDGRLVVVEGNRRLAAVRILCDSRLREELNATSIPEIPPDIADDLKELPVIRCRRDHIWQYVGFKHVNGPQAWNSFAKAEYVAWVRNDLGTEIAEIASTLGDTHSIVARLYRAYMALKQAEDSGVYDREQRARKIFSFSHLYTGLDYSGIQEFTGIADLDSLSKEPIPAKKMKEFGELCTWLWGDKSRNQPALIRSQNPHLRELDETLKSADGLCALRAGHGLKQSLDITRGDTALFRESLLNARLALQGAHAKVVTGFSGEADLSRSVEEIVSLAEALHDDMSAETLERRKRRQKSRKR